MVILPPPRPDTALLRVISALTPLCSPLAVTSRMRIHWEYRGKSQLYIIKRGEISLVRAADGLVIATAYEANLFGLAESLQPMRSHFLRVGGDCELLRVDVVQAHACFTQNDLWRDVIEIVAYHTGYLFYRDSLVMHQRSYSIIRGHLLELIRLPDDMRMRVTILDYIQERTFLSRTSILSVLTALKEGAYITYKRGGYLTEVMDLPQKF